MEDVRKQLEQYEANKVQYRTQFCPRKGYFRIVSVYTGFCLGKPALMAKINWKLQQLDDYSSQTFEIQLESFKSNSSKEQLEIFKSSDLIGKEIRVSHILCYNKPHTFLLTWEFLSSPTVSLSELNKLLKNNPGSVNLGANDDFHIPDNYGDVDFFEGGY